VMETVEKVKQKSNKRRTRRKMVTLRTSGEVVEPAGEVNVVLDDINEKKDLIARPATDESTTDHQRRHDRVASRRTDR